nr:hypothetical protein [Bacillus sp. FJAT-27225]
MERKVRDSCGTSGTGETPQSLWRRGGSPHAPRKASILERKSTTASKLFFCTGKIVLFCMESSR